jgi:hypothetical protein
MPPTGGTIVMVRQNDWLKPVLMVGSTAAASGMPGDADFPVHMVTVADLNFPHLAFFETPRMTYG